MHTLHTDNPLRLLLLHYSVVRPASESPLPFQLLVFRPSPSFLSLPRRHTSRTRSISTLVCPPRVALVSLHSPRPSTPRVASPRVRSCPLVSRRLPRVARRPSPVACRPSPISKNPRHRYRRTLSPARDVTSAMPLGLGIGLGASLHRLFAASCEAHLRVPAPHGFLTYGSFFFQFHVPTSISLFVLLSLFCYVFSKGLMLSLRPDRFSLDYSCVSTVHTLPTA
jgi:hypothetical protein